MKFAKAEVKVVKINSNDIVTASGIASCSVVGMFVEECDFE